jgi:hypothetical protein
MTEPLIKPYDPIRALEKFGENIKELSTDTTEFWKHLVIVEATVLGLTIGLLGASGQTPSCFLRLSWILLLVAITFGCTLIKFEIDLRMVGAVRAYILGDDIAEIEAMIARGELVRGSEKHAGLITALGVATMPLTKNTKGMWTKEALELAKKYDSQRPSAKMMHPPKRSWIDNFFELQRQKHITTFYLLSLVAFIFLVCTAMK